MAFDQHADHAPAQPNRDPRTAELLELLESTPEIDRECRQRIEIWLDRVLTTANARRRQDFFGSKIGRRQMRRALKALVEVRDAYAAFDPRIRPWLSLVETAYVVGAPTVLDREIAKLQIMLETAGRSQPKRGDALTGKLAALAAWDLYMWRYGKRPSISRGGKAERIGRVIAGQRHDVFEHLRDLLKKPPEPQIEKVGPGRYRSPTTGLPL